MKCPVCFHHCELCEGTVGYCKARTVRDGEMAALNAGAFTGMALDPIEKKPLRRFFPGSKILSLGSWGCNMRCPWCQNDHISRGPADAVLISAEQILNRAVELKKVGNIGIAFTYNEPLINPELIREIAFPAHDLGLKNALVTNGMVEPDQLAALLPAIDALNIDLKTINPENYARIGGNLDTVLENIRLSAETAHVEVTTLIVPGFNDDEAEMAELAARLAEINPEVPLHVTRFFPAGEMKFASPTPIPTVYHFADIAQKYLRYVYPGNV